MKTVTARTALLMEISEACIDIITPYVNNAILVGLMIASLLAYHDISRLTILPIVLMICAVN